MAHQRDPDLLVIGAGPAGLTAALFAKNRGLQVVVLEGAEAGGQLRSVYPHKPVYNYPGIGGVPAGELAARMVEQTVSAGVTITLGGVVESIEPGDQLILARTHTSVHVARAAVVATGLGLFQPRHANVPGEEAEAGRTIFYTIVDPSTWRDRDVIVLGGGDSAVDNALFLRRSGARVTLVHRREALHAQRESVRQLESEGVPMLLGCTVEGFDSGDGRLRVSLSQNAGGTRRTLSVDRALVNVGTVARGALLGSFRGAGTRTRVPVDTEMRASVPGVFACGDVAEYPGKVRLIVTAMGEAATAVASVERYLQGHAGTGRAGADESRGG